MTITNKFLNELLESCERPEDLLGDTGLRRIRRSGWWSGC